MNIEVVNGTDGQLHAILYQYNPSQTAAYVYVGLFGVITLAHFIYMFPMRCAFFIPFIIGGICETGGYYGRAWSSREPDNLGPFMLQSMLIMVAPPFLAATIYMTLSRLVRALEAEHLSSIRPRVLTRILVLTDIICFCSQLAGTGLQATGNPKIMHIGGGVVLGGLIFQLVLLSFFTLVALRFHRRIHRDATLVPTHTRWGRYFVALYFQAVAIFVRNLVRCVEYAGGAHGFVNTHEAMTYVFDASLMLLVMLVSLVVHPGWLLKAAQRLQKGEGRGSPELESGTIPLTYYNETREE